MIYRNLAIAAAVSAAAACASGGGSGTTDQTGATTTTATTDSLGATATTGAQTTATDTAVTTTTEAATTVDSASARSSSDMSASGNTAGAAQMDSLIGVLERGITTVPQAEALAAISGFESYLSSSGDASLSGMSSDFAALRTQLQQPNVDNKAVGTALTTLGTRASSAAQAGGANSDRISRLAQALTAAGSKLSGGM